jgi:signal peptidase I
MKEQMNREQSLYYFQKKKNPDKEKRELLLYSILLLLFLYLSIIFNTVIFSNVFVQGDSMEPTIQTGDVLYINKLVKPKHNDIIVLQAVENSEPYIKRVIGLEGDTIRCQTRGVVEIKYAGSDVFVTLENYNTESLTPVFNNPQIFVEFEITVGENEVFFLGDNRAISEDSTELGCRPTSKIIGVVTNWSLRYKTFFTKLWKIID